MFVQIFGLLYVRLAVAYSKYFHSSAVFFLNTSFSDQIVNYADICGFDFFCELGGLEAWKIYEHGKSEYNIF